MLGRFALGAVVAASWVMPVAAGMMTADEAKRFTAGKVFAFTCFDGTRGAGRVFDDGSAAGSVQFSGSGPTRYMRLPGATLQVRGQTICASLKGIPFEPCFNLQKRDERSFRGSVAGMGFAYCDFRHQGGGGQRLMARAMARPRSLHPPEAAKTEVSAKVETPRVEAARLDPPKPEPKLEAKAEVKTEAKAEAKAEAAPELRRSTE